MTVTLDQLDRVTRLNSPLYQRIRANCCPEHGLGSDKELDRHAAAVCLTITSRAYTVAATLHQRARAAGH